jgi:hypothetical protein
MRTGNTSNVLSANVGKEYVEKFVDIHNYYNDKDNFFYVRKRDVLKQLIDEKHNQLFGQ